MIVYAVWSHRRVDGRRYSTLLATFPSRAQADGYAIQIEQQFLDAPEVRMMRLIELDQLSETNRPEEIR